MRNASTAIDQKYIRACRLIDGGMSANQAIKTTGMSAPSFYARKKKPHVTTKTGTDGKQYINITTQPKRAGTTVKKFRKLYTMTKLEKQVELTRVLRVLRKVSKQLATI